MKSIHILIVSFAILLLTAMSAAAQGPCATSKDCQATHMCVKEDGDCYGSGVCVPKPRACVVEYRPVCGCDDALYYNRCEASFFGESIYNEGACAPDPDDPEAIQICDYTLTNFRVNIGNKMGSRFTYSDETFNAYTLDGEPIGHLVLEDRKVASVGCEVKETATYNVYVRDLVTVQDIFSADNKLDAFDTKLSEGEIRIEGQMFSKKVKGSVTRAMVKVMSWFS